KQLQLEQREPEDTITAEKQNMSKPKRSAGLQESLLTTNTPMWPKSHQLELREALCRSQGATSCRRFQERFRSVFPFSVRPPAESRLCRAVCAPGLVGGAALLLITAGETTPRPSDPSSSSHCTSKNTESGRLSKTPETELLILSLSTTPESKKTPRILVSSILLQNKDASQIDRSRACMESQKESLPSLLGRRKEDQRLSGGPALRSTFPPTNSDPAPDPQSELVNVESVDQRQSPEN
ncbi:DNA replication protein DnaC, partial [Dissostichus eleginoides]